MSLSIPAMEIKTLQQLMAHRLLFLKIQYGLLRVVHPKIFDAKQTDELL